MTALSYFHLVWDDVDTFDQQAVSGTVTITPNISRIITANDDNKTTLSPKPIVTTLAGGVLVDSANNPYVSLPCDSSLLGLSTTLQYNVQFRAMKTADGRPARGFLPFTFDAPTSTADFPLHDAIPVASSPGVLITRGPAGPAGATGAQGPAGATSGVVGPTGLTGAAGAAGANGVDGRTVLNGTTVPSSGLGANGDFYIKTDTSMLYGPKASGAWGGGVSLVGATGAAGTISTTVHANFVAFPGTGVTDHTYIAADTRLSYFWDGAAYQLYGGSGSGGGLAGYVGLVPAITAGGTATLTHGLNSFNVEITVRRSWLPTGLTPTTPGEIIRVKSRVTGLNTIRLEPDDAFAANEFIILVNPVSVAADNTGPTAGVLSSPSQGISTVDLSLTGGADAGVGNAGVTWFRTIAGVPTSIGQSPGDTFTDTGLTSNTAYTYMAKRFDLYGNDGAVSNSISPSTILGGPVTPIGSPVQNRSATSGVATVTPTYVAGPNRIAIAVVSVSHSEWIPSSAYTTLKVEGGTTGLWTRLVMPSSTDVGNWFGQPSGGVHLFYKLNPPTSASGENVVATFAKTTATVITPVAATISVEQYSGVDQIVPFDAPVAQSSDGPASLVVSSAIGSYTIFGGGFRSSVVAGNYNGTVVYLSGTAATAGYDLYTIHGRQTGAATVTNTVSVTSNYAAFGVNIRKAT